MRFIFGGLGGVVNDSCARLRAHASGLPQRPPHKKGIGFANIRVAGKPSIPQPVLAVKADLSPVGFRNEARDAEVPKLIMPRVVLLLTTHTHSGDSRFANSHSPATHVTVALNDILFQHAIPHGGINE